MHLVPAGGRNVLKLVTSPRARWRFLDRTRALLVGFASRLANYESFESGPRVTVPLLRSGGVGVALSVLYSPFDEMDLTLRYPGEPQDHYFRTLLRQLDAVERDIRTNFANQAAIAHNPAELDAAIDSDMVALVHCVEGGFHLGAEPEHADEAVRELARRGVAYITLAHLFYRRVATNINAVPFLPDFAYDLLFPQPDLGLTELGHAAVRAMTRERVLCDLSHMSERALADTFALLDELDPDRSVPVIASHVAYRFGRQDYNLDAETVQRVAQRGGVIGLILSQHQGADGMLLGRHPESLEDSMKIVSRHLDRFCEITGSHRHTAIGSDLDGFIKPTLAGLEHAGRLGQLEAALADRYGPDDAALIASGNVLRLLRDYWRGAPGSG
jgi:microsomal dipeptidase-like Zn-dependent dipeptidase